MEYLKSIKQHLKKINESNIKYLDIIKNPSLVYGNTSNSNMTDFCKYPSEVEKDIRKFGGSALYYMQYHKTSSCGCRIRFKTTSKRIVFKVQLKRASTYKEMILWNSSGFDVYIIDKDGNYVHNNLIAPQSRKNIFAEQIWLPKNSSVCIFLPNYDTIEKMYIGIENGSRIATFPYRKEKSLPIVFHGNGITQGASATKSGNSFPNIVSRKLDNDIINLSAANCCKGLMSVADLIGRIDCSSIIIDYSRDAKDADDLKKYHESFYKKIREAHPDKKIIIMTTACFNNEKKYEDYDEVILNTYKNAIERKENTLLLNQKKLFENEDKSLIAVDGFHYNDYAMFKIADKICELLTS